MPTVRRNIRIALLGEASLRGGLPIDRPRREHLRTPQVA